MIIIDETILKKDDGIYKKHSEYENVVNYVSLNEGKLISFINSKIPMGPSRIKINREINFLDNVDKFPKLISIYNKLNDYIKASDYTLWKREKINPNKIDTCNIPNDLLQSLYNSVAVKKKDVFSDNKLNNYMFEIINSAFTEFFKTKDPTIFKRIIGIGPGLTPFGDDVLCGALYCKNIIDYNDCFNSYISQIAKKYTTIISANFIINACENNYSDDIRKFVLGIFDSHTINKKVLDSIFNYGSSSGFGIVYGFTKYLENYLKLEKTYE